MDIKNHSTLATNLVSYWDLEEASGTRYDLVGSNDLTDNNTVGQTTGKIGNAADFVAANTEYLSRSAQTWGVSNAWSVSLWAKCDNISANPRFFNLGDGSSGANNIVFLFQNVSTGYFYVQVYGGTGGTSDRKIYKFLPTDVTALTHYVATWDGTNLKLYENGTEETSPTKDDDDTLTAMTNASRAFGIGALSSGAVPLDGTIDEVGLWSKALTSTEVSDLYNSGDGLPYEAAAASTFTPKVIMF